MACISKTRDYLNKLYSRLTKAIRNYIYIKKQFITNKANYVRKLQSLKFFPIINSNIKLLIYTDSRGNNLTKHDDYLHYPELLNIFFNTDKHLCPEKWTTTLDFLDFWQKQGQKEKYDFVLLHTGIVDYSPRHQTIAKEKIYKDKKDIFDNVFGKQIIKEYLDSDFKVEYEGDKTINLYSTDMAKKYLLPELKKIKNLIWISNNIVLPDWNGNYWKERPRNMNIVDSYADLFSDSLDNVVDLRSWNEKDVKKYTFDNIHLNKLGSDIVFAEVVKKIQELTRV